jgi:hypothetical protein
MAEILSFQDKKNEKSIAKAHDDVILEEHRVKLMNLYAQMQHVLKEINYHKEVIRLLEKGNK